MKLSAPKAVEGLEVRRLRIQLQTAPLLKDGPETVEEARGLHSAELPRVQQTKLRRNGRTGIRLHQGLDPRE